MFDLNNSLNTTSGREGPAGSAVPLIFHRSDGTFGGPVNRSTSLNGDSFEISERDDLGGRISEFGFESKVDGFEFSRGQVRELVDTTFVSAVSTVVVEDEIHVELEDGEAAEEFLRGIVLLKFQHEVGEFVLVVLFREDISMSNSYERRLCNVTYV